jgi:hypothetical protein
VPQVAWQHQKAFDQRTKQGRDHHQRNGADDGADNVADHEHRQEGGDGGQGRGQDGRGHALGPQFRCRQSIQAAPALHLRVLTHDDGVVDDNTQHQDHAEQADHVDALPCQQHDAHGTQQGRRNTERDPERNPEIQKDDQHQQHDNQAADAVVDQ